MSLFFLPDLPAKVLLVSAFPESSGISISSVTVIFGPVRSEVLAASLTKLPDTVQSHARLMMDSTPITAAVMRLRVVVVESSCKKGKLEEDEVSLVVFTNIAKFTGAQCA